MIDARWYARVAALPKTPRFEALPVWSVVRFRDVNRQWVEGVVVGYYNTREEYIVCPEIGHLYYTARVECLDGC